MDTKRIFAATDEDLAHAMNLWMQDYIDHPEKFYHNHTSIVEFLKEKNGGREPTYGESCVATLRGYLGCK